MFVAAVTAGALFATVSGANAAPASSHHTSAGATASAHESGFEAAYPNDSAAQAALSPLFANEEVRHTLLAEIAGGKKSHKLVAAD
ncbi:hypothetical protein [Streptomyces sp. NBC_01481]|uniref:hypothetical protein n=1 Tax=Streptomyces sp. NBC_01481 TaxID=2975869 RepID=UPI00224C91EF|nr:hypothetical protein [Streptomyces sp. NBC_01481]MCX4588116.1 hypothetical protein [Streptomyces sp. NBC_01481]